MSKQLTPWYPAEVKPVRIGVYEVKDNGMQNYSYFNGERFGWRSHSIFGAANQNHLVTALSPTVQWRGLARKPK